nr:HEAT repeat domain-containing protein [Candidatus Sigynarchaeota archaeon]
LPFLNDNELTIKEAATIALGNVLNGDPAIITGLINCLTDTNETVRENGILALGKIGKYTIPVVESLMVALKDPSWGVRQAAARALAGIGEDAEQVIPVLANALEDKDWRVRSRVLQSLVHVGLKTVPDLLRMVTDGSLVAKKCAIEALGELHAKSDDVLNVLEIMLSSGNRVLRGKIADALRTIGEPALPVLLKHLNDDPNDVLIIWAIGKMDYDHPRIIPALVKVLQTGNTRAKVEAARSVGNLTRNIEPAIPVLIEIVTGKFKKRVRIEATNTLGKTGSKDPSVERTLVLGLEDKAPEVRWRSAEALGKLGMTGAIVDLKKLSHDREDFVASAALESLDKLEN